MKKLVVLSGAGISAESGIKTFRDADGLWEGHDVMSVASPQGWQKDPILVLDFYNQRRAQLKSVEPNLAHKAIVDLESAYQVNVVTQNVDDLHERAGSSRVLHLHGELLKVRSTLNENLVYDCDRDIFIGNTCELGSQLRPHIVWFGEPVPLLEQAVLLVNEADVILIIGTSLQVYPAAGLINYASAHSKVFLIDPRPNIENIESSKIEVIKETATIGMTLIKNKLLDIT